MPGQYLLHLLQFIFFHTGQDNFFFHALRFHPGTLVSMMLLFLMAHCGIYQQQLCRKELEDTFLFRLPGRPASVTSGKGMGEATGAMHHRRGIGKCTDSGQYKLTYQ
jgi:hypothetical protein